jgi:hypothetical protein
MRGGHNRHRKTWIEPRPQCLAGSHAHEIRDAAARGMSGKMVCASPYEETMRRRALPLPKVAFGSF